LFFSTSRPQSPARAWTDIDSDNTIEWNVNLSASFQARTGDTNRDCPEFHVDLTDPWDEKASAWTMIVYDTEL
jgi:hypothetical protein